MIWKIFTASWHTFQTAGTRRSTTIQFMHRRYITWHSVWLSFDSVCYSIYYCFLLVFFSRFVVQFSRSANANAVCRLNGCSKCISSNFFSHCTFMFVAAWFETEFFLQKEENKSSSSEKAQLKNENEKQYSTKVECLRLKKRVETCCADGF